MARLEGIVGYAFQQGTRLQNQAVQRGVALRRLKRLDVRK